MKKRLSILMSLLTIAVTSIAQDRIITGKVTSADDGSELAGINVTLKGTRIGTVTNYKGEYAINAPNGNGVFVFSFVGLISQEIRLSVSDIIDVSMISDVSQFQDMTSLYKIVPIGVEKESFPIDGLKYPSVIPNKWPILDGCLLLNSDTKDRGAKK